MLWERVRSLRVHVWIFRDTEPLEILHRRMYVLVCALLERQPIHFALKQPPLGDWVA